MGQAVVVFSFPEPQDSITLGIIVESAKKSFVNMDDVKIHLGIKNVADEIISVFDPLHKEESNLVEHAKRELELAGNDEDFNKALINAVRAFASYGHSGGSASVAIPMLSDLLQFKNLTPLTDNPEEWIHHTEGVWGEPGGIWQNRRNSGAFSNDGGKTYYLLSEGGNNKNPGPSHYSAPHIPKPIQLAKEFIEENND